MPAKVYTDKDADLGVFKNKTLAILGYGSQGHAHALNLKESGCKVIIGLYPGSKSRKVAEQHGLKVYDTAEAVRLADVIMVGLPDMKQADVYESDIKPNLTKGKCLIFSHGLAVHFGIIKPADLPPLEQFLASLPNHVAEGLRAYIAQAVLTQRIDGERGPDEAGT
jgi:ketol-acid reductoisomerase